MNAAVRTDATFMTIDGLGAADLFVLWALRQRLSGMDECQRMVSLGFHRTLGCKHAAPALASFEDAYRVLASHGTRVLNLLPPSCGFITRDETCLLALCRAAQAGSCACTRRQARALVGPAWSPFLSTSLERFTRVLVRRSLRLSSTAATLRHAYH